MLIAQKRNVFFAISGALVLLSIVSLGVFGLKLGIDFSGGTLVQVSYPEERPAPNLVTEALQGAGLEEYSLREAGEKDYVLRTGALSEIQRGSLSEILSGGDRYQGSITQLTEVGPTVGTELRNKALIALVLVLSAILLFVAFAFRKVSEPVSSWIYGLIALLTLAFDVLIPIGFYAYLGHAMGATIDVLFVTAALTILGYSVHDTIVVFDRTRENLRLNQERNKREDFAETAGRALGQTLVRSVTTSLTTILALAALFVAGPESTKVFALTLLVGIVAGTYSSIFLATPLLVAFEKWRGKK